MHPIPKALEIQIEISRWSCVKRRPDQSIDFIAPLPCPFNYGSVRGRAAPDGDPEDALVLGNRVEALSVVRMPVWGRIVFVDAGVEDHKWVCGRTPPSESEWKALEKFFQVYALSKRFLYFFRRTRGEVNFLGVERFAVERSSSR